jgi:hypothetical protein
MSLRGNLHLRYKVEFHVEGAGIAIKEIDLLLGRDE